MRRTLALTCLALVPLSSALAETTTIRGTGDIEKMRVNNGTKALTVKVWGLAKPCDAHFLHITVFWGRQRAYRAEAGCYPTGTGSEWLTSLWYHRDRDAGSGGKEVRCGRFRSVYEARSSTYRIVIPRRCMGKAPDRVRVEAQGRNYVSPMGGEVGPTKSLRRG